MQALTIPFGCPPELVNKTFSLKTPHTLATRYLTNEAGSELELLLAFPVLEVAIGVAFL